TEGYLHTAARKQRMHFEQGCEWRTNGQLDLAIAILPHSDDTGSQGGGFRSRAIHLPVSANKFPTRWHQTFSNSLFTISFSSCGFAFPPMAFMVWPTKNPSSDVLPDLYFAMLSGLAASTDLSASISAPSSETCTIPRSSTICFGPTSEPI